MSRKWLIVGLCVAVCLSALAYHEYASTQIQHAMAAAGPNDTIDPMAKIANAMSLIVAALGGLGSIFAAMHRWEGTLSPGTAKEVLAFVISTSERRSIKDTRDRSVDPVVRASARQIAIAQFQLDQKAAQAEFDAEFPIDPKIDVPSSMGAKP